MHGYTHAPGDHCGSAALRNLADYYDWGFDEPACFGLGAGIGFGYYERGPASRMMMGRTAHLETAFFDHLGVPVVHTDGQSRETAWTALDEWVENGPVVCFVDLYYLPYFETDTHFGPHTVVVTDVDDDAVTVSDSEFPEPQTVSRDAFDDAWNSAHGFGPLDRRWLAVDEPTRTVATETATREAAGLAAETMLHGGERWGSGGVEAIRTFANDLPEWNRFDDVRWTARFAYQNIERRGTGGGAFRRLYADFLESLGADAGFDARFGERMHAVADDWATLGALLKSVSETADADGRADLLADASDLAGDLADREESLFADLAEVA